MYTVLVERILASTLVNKLLPNGIKMVLDMIAVSSNFHPRRWGQWYEKEIERVWLEEMDVIVAPEVDAATNPTTSAAASTKSSNKNHNHSNNEDNANLVDSPTCHPPPRHVVVGLSVRTLLDLYLSTKSYPVGSEVIIVPPVSIPGMVDVLEYHGMTLVPVDLPTGGGGGGGGDGKEEEENDGDHNPQSTVLETFIPSDCRYWGFNIPGVEAAISPRTVAILVVHPFGTVMSPLTMNIVRRIAEEHGVEIWEDCAQCYTGSSGGGGVGGGGGGSSNKYPSNFVIQRVWTYGNDDEN